MDREKPSRSFQNAKMTFQELAQEILANYKDADLIYAAAGKAVGSLIVQYEETDWEFLQRVLSREGIMITPGLPTARLKIICGSSGACGVSISLSYSGYGKGYGRIL